MNMFRRTMTSFAFGLAVLAPQMVNANNVERYTLEKQVAESDVVFSGYVAGASTQRGAIDKFVIVQVIETLKGSPGKSILLLVNGDISELNPRCCNEGETYLFFVKRIQGNKYASVNGPFGVYEIGARK